MTFLIFLIVLGVVVFVHELGHFVVAKLAGVYVDVFSLGFGPRLLGVRIGETDYRISLIPLGGYVRMAGQSDVPEDMDDEIAARYRDVPVWRRYDRQSIATRVAIIAAGPLMNLLFALPVAFAMLVIGVREPLDVDATTVGQILPGSPAAVAGLVPGDRIIAVDDTPVKEWEKVVTSIRTRLGDQITLTYLRNGDTNRATLTPGVDKEVGYVGIGIQQMHRAQIAAIVSNSPAGASGLIVGDVIDRMVGQYADDLSMHRLIDAIQERPDRKIVLGVKRFADVRSVMETTAFARARIVLETERAGKIAHVTLLGATIFPDATAPSNFPLRAGDTLISINGSSVSPDTANDIVADLPRGDVSLHIERIEGTILKERTYTNVTATITDVGRIGVVFTAANQTVRYPPLAALKECGVRSWDRFVETLQVLRMLFQRKLGISTLTGPVGIARMTGAAAATGIDVLLSLVLIITINLGILNLLPIPVLDGGHILLLGLEAIYRKPLPMKFVIWCQKIGGILLLALVIYVFYNDIVSWIADNDRLGLFLGRLWRAVIR